MWLMRNLRLRRTVGVKMKRRKSQTSDFIRQCVTTVASPLKNSLKWRAPSLLYTYRMPEDLFIIPLSSPQPTSLSHNSKEEQKLSGKRRSEKLWLSFINTCRTGGRCTPAAWTVTPSSPSSLSPSVETPGQIWQRLQTTKSVLDIYSALINL